MAVAPVCRAAHGTGRAIAAFLDCGDLHAGFTRLRCPECGHEFLRALSCKQRGLCAPCHQRRTGWRELIKRVWGADPLKYPLCSGLLQPIAVVETAAEIHAVLAPLGLILPVRCTQTGRSHDRPYAHGPPVPEGTVLVAADSLSACTAQAGGADGEPVFWTGGAEQTGPADDFVQPDLSAPVCVQRTGRCAGVSLKNSLLDGERPEVWLFTS